MEHDGIAEALTIALESGEITSERLMTIDCGDDNSPDEALLLRMVLAKTRDGVK